MPDPSAPTNSLSAALQAVEPAARLVPARALRRAIRQSRDRGTFRPRPVHDRGWWIRRDELLQWLTPPELGLTDSEPPELLLIPVSDPPPCHRTLWRILFHGAIDRELTRAGVSDDLVRRVRQELGPARWHQIRTVLTEENLIDETDADESVVRECVAFGWELARFAPEDWETFLPDVDPDGEPFRSARSMTDPDGLYDRTRPPSFGEPPTERQVDHSSPPAPDVHVKPVPDVSGWLARGNDLKAAILLERAGEARGREHLHHLMRRLAEALNLDEASRQQWLAAVEPLLGPAARGGWPVERRLLYELQRTCLAVERTHYTADLLEWVRTLGTRSLKRPLPKTRWVEAHRRFRAALGYAELLLADRHDPGLHDLLTAAIQATETNARRDLRPELIGVLDEVGLVPRSVAERHSRDALVEELLDGALARGFLRIGDLRDAIARNRIKLPDLSGPGEFVRGDPLIRANELLPVRLDGVYRRGELYMRLLQRGCSVFFGTRVGRWFSRYVALPFGGAFILLEAIGHLYEAGAGAVHWFSGWSATVNGVGLLGGGAASTLAANPTLEHGGVRVPAVLAVGLFLLLLLHWPDFRACVIAASRLAFLKVPRAVRRSPQVRFLVHNRVTRFIRRNLLIPGAAAGLGALASWMLGGDFGSVALVAGGMAVLAATFFRTAFGREVEDRFDEAMERVWRVVSVNFVIGLLTLILAFFRALFEAIDQGIHAVDEALRFREGQGRGAFAAKLVFGAGWFAFTYVFRFAWTLLVEPQVNPIKHFPVVTVSHKILLPLIPPLAKQLGVSTETMATIVFGIPGIFGFLVWELKENWKLYRANAPAGLRPAQVGSHGETVRGLLRPGFHSGTVPKVFGRLRRAVRDQVPERAARQGHLLEHVAENVHRFADRTMVVYLRQSGRWAGRPVALQHPHLAPNRLLLPFDLGAERGTATVALEERNGWVIGSITNADGLCGLDPAARAAFADALVGLYKRAGVDAVREQVAAAFGPQAYTFDAVPEGLVITTAGGKERLFDLEDGPEVRPVEYRLPTGAIVLSDHPVSWAEWAARWDADAAGEHLTGPLIPGWAVLPPAS